MTQARGNGRNDWLTPSAALNHFKSSKGAILGIKQAAQKKLLRYGFRLGEIGLLIGLSTASEVMDSVPIYPLPQTPAWLIGVINLRGNLVPIFDLKRLLELEGESLEKPRILILGKGESALGMIIDGFPRPVDTTDTLSRLPPLPNILKPHVPQAHAWDKIVWLEFDHQGFFHSLISQIGTAG